MAGNFTVVPATVGGSMRTSMPRLASENSLMSVGGPQKLSPVRRTWFGRIGHGLFSPGPSFGGPVITGRGAIPFKGPAGA